MECAPKGVISAALSISLPLNLSEEKPMFHTLSYDLRTVEAKLLPLAKHKPSKGHGFKFFGPRARSYLGCLCCRRRKYVDN